MSWIISNFSEWKQVEEQLMQGHPEARYDVKEERQF